jgi:hypothetical protein
VNDTIDLLRRIDLQREIYNPHTDNQQFKLDGSKLTPVYANTFIARMYVSFLSPFFSIAVYDYL